MPRFRGTWSLYVANDTKSPIISQLKTELKGDDFSRRLNPATLSDRHRNLEEHSTWSVMTFWRCALWSQSVWVAQQSDLMLFPRLIYEMGTAPPTVSFTLPDCQCIQLTMTKTSTTTTSLKSH